MVQFFKQPTLEFDSLTSLVNGYKAAFPGKTTSQAAQAIAEANGVAWHTPAVEAWISGLSGKRYPYDPKSNPGLGKGVGWSYFGAGNMIFLPDVPRVGVTTATPNQPNPPPQVAQPAQATPPPKKGVAWTTWVFAGAAGFVLYLLFSESKKSKSPKSALADQD